MTKKQKYWFKRKRYGYGWTPSTWQGGVLVLAFVTVVFAVTLRLDGASDDDIAGRLAVFFAAIFISFLALLYISSKKAPTGRWRWGSKASDNSDEDS
jgi:hypothetical protein